MHRSRAPGPSRTRLGSGVTTPALSAPEAFRCDLHMHSHHSYDCLVKPRAIFRAARRRGLQAVAVTDHETIAGGLEARAAAPSNLLVIVGCEIRTDCGDIVCLFLHEEIRSRDALDVIAEAHAQGGIAFLPHPLFGHPPRIPDAVLDACDGFEALNSRAGPFSPIGAPTGGGTRWERLIRKAMLANSDAHFASEIGVAWTEMSGPATEETIKSCILERRTRARGSRAPRSGFYRSQLIRMVKTRNYGMLYSLGRRVLRKIF
jgi:predicted metal-dependent phosphoesterase TrpH